MTYRCVDVETTSLPKDGEASGLMEVGWCDLHLGFVRPPESTFVDCSIPVSIEARAVHHISDAMVKGAPGPSEASARVSAGGHLYVAAHNVDHEKHYIGTGFAPGTEDLRPWICTYKTSLRIWPEAPGHKLMELRYHLGLDASEDFDPRLADPPHRAAADAYVCAHLLRRILAEPNVTVEQLVRWSSGPALLYMCHMKKHKGTPWSQVDKSYLDWIVNKSDITDRDIRATAKYYLTRDAK